MDLNSVSIAQSHPANQLRFDADAFDAAILRAERRRAAVRKRVLRLAARHAAITAELYSIIKMALSKRPA